MPKTWKRPSMRYQESSACPPGAQRKSSYLATLNPCLLTPCISLEAEGQRHEPISQPGRVSQELTVYQM
jgi:hypothetical protein